MRKLWDELKMLEILHKISSDQREKKDFIFGPVLIGIMCYFLEQHDYISLFLAIEILFLGIYTQLILGYLDNRENSIVTYLKINNSKFIYLIYKYIFIICFITTIFNYIFINLVISIYIMLFILFFINNYLIFLSTKNSFIKIISLIIPFICIIFLSNYYEMQYSEMLQQINKIEAKFDLKLVLILLILNVLSIICSYKFLKHSIKIKNYS